MVGDKINPTKRIDWWFYKYSSDIKKNNMTAIAETVIILAVFVTFMGYLEYKLAYEDGY